MKRVLYRSTSAQGVGSADVFQIIETASRRNPKSDLTGFLLHDGETFLQMLEGPPLEVEGILARIERDPRHSDIQILYEDTAEERWFPDWAMKRLINFGGTPAIDELREILGDKREGSRVLEIVANTLRA